MKNSNFIVAVAMTVTVLAAINDATAQNRNMNGPNSYSWSTSHSSFSSTMTNVPVMDALKTANQFANQNIRITRAAVDVLNRTDKKISMSVTHADQTRILDAVVAQTELTVSTLVSADGKTKSPLIDVVAAKPNSETFLLSTLIQNAALEQVMPMDIMQMPLEMALMNFQMQYGIHIKTDSKPMQTFGNFPSGVFPELVSVKARGMTVRDCLKEIARQKKLKYSEASGCVRLTR